MKYQKENIKKKLFKITNSPPQKKKAENKLDQRSENYMPYTYIEDYKTLMKEIEENSKTNERYPLGLEGLMLKWLYYPKQSTDLM